MIGRLQSNVKSIYRRNQASEYDIVTVVFLQVAESGKKSSVRNMLTG